MGILQDNKIQIAALTAVVADLQDRVEALERVAAETWIARFRRWMKG